MLKVIISDDYLAIDIKNLSDDVVTFICENVLDENGVAFTCYSSEIVVSSNLYETLNTLTMDFELIVR